jgi:WD40 repeat protein
VIMSGSDDNTVRIWEIESGKIANTLDHNESVRDLRFNDNMIVTSASDGQSGKIRIWDTTSPEDVTLRKILDYNPLHYYALNYDEKYIIACECANIIIWNTSDCGFVHHLIGHKGISCLHYRTPHVVS